jgi:hypothetical protein
MTIQTSGMARHVVDTGAIKVSPEPRDVTEADRRRIGAWRQFHQIAEIAPVQIVSFPGDALHDSSLRQWLHAMRDKLRGRRLAILYLHCGHQLDTRSPILQHLLNQLDITQSAFALRIENEEARRDAWSMASALLHTHESVLLLHDDFNRLAERGPISGSLTYALLARGGDRRDLPDSLPMSRAGGFAPPQGEAVRETCV